MKEAHCLDPQATSWPPSVAALARQAGVIRPGASLLLGGPVLDDELLAQASRDVCELLALFASLPGRVFGGDLRAFGAYHGFTWDEVEVLLASGQFDDDGSSFARADMVRTPHGFRLVELNVGSSVGGMAMASAPAMLGLPQADPPLRAWARFVARRAGSGGTGVIVEDSAILAEEMPHLSWQAEALQHEAGGRVDVIGHRDIHVVGAQLVGPHGRLDWFYPAFSARDVNADRSGYAPLMAGVRGGMVRMPVDLSAKLLGSKLLLATVYEMAERGELSSRETELVLRLLPRTRRLNAGLLDEAVARRDDWVFKPGVGYGGFGVEVGREVDPARWQALLDNALLTPLAHCVLQQRCDPMPEHALLGLPDGQVLAEEAQFVWGFYAAGGRACGSPLLRCRPLSASRVINYAGGATGGPMPPRSSHEFKPDFGAA